MGTTSTNETLNGILVCLPGPIFYPWFQVFDLLMNGSDLVAQLQRNTKYFRSVLEEAGFTLMVSGERGREGREGGEGEREGRTREKER